MQAGVSLSTCRRRWTDKRQCLRKAPPERKVRGKMALRAPNRGVQSRFCCWIAGRGLGQEECLCPVLLYYSMV